jgi:sulfur carrier protein
MTLTVNGEPRDVGVDTLGALLALLGLEGAAVATALNGSFVPKGKRAATTLQPGDRIEIVSPMQGG